MVCKANICRSPMAQKMLQAELSRAGMSRRVRVDSAGTNASQIGRQADPRATAILKRQGVAMGKSRARQVRSQDFEKFDYILAMDHENLAWTMKRSPADKRHRIRLLGEWSGKDDPVDIPDPYFGNMSSFERVFELLERSIHGFMTELFQDVEIGVNEALSDPN